MVFDACCYGGQRKTAKRFLTNVEPMKAMAQRCPGGHQHLPFGRVKLGSGKYAYATAQEAAYPRALCLQIVAQVCQALKLPTTAIQAQPKAAIAIAAAAKSPRGRKVPSLVPEFACISVVQLDTLPPVDTKWCLTMPIGNIPQGSKFLSHVMIKTGDVVDHGIRFECSFGIYRSKSEFLSKALQLVHPFDELCPLKDDCIRMIFTLVTKGPLWVVNKRIEVLKRWTAKAKSLLSDDRRLKDHLEAGVSSVLASKKILLLQFLADQVGWPDTEIVTLMQSGFDLVGNAAPSGVLDVELKPAEITADKLLEDRKFMKPALLGKVRSSVVDEDLFIFNPILYRYIYTTFSISLDASV